MAGANREPRGDKKERILAAAIKVFANKGFFQAKVSEIAREAGVADGTIYLYFDNKDDLLIQVFEESMELVISRLRDALEGVDATEEKVRRFIEQHLRMVVENPELAEVITVELRQSSKFMKEYKNPKFSSYLKMITDIVAEGSARGVLRSDFDAAMVARALFGMLDELALTWVLVRRFEMREVAEFVYEFFMNGMRNANP
jgi:TetR/AcrR family fatty acid metabolism transcriptional regulator